MQSVMKVLLRFGVCVMLGAASAHGAHDVTTQADPSATEASAVDVQPAAAAQNGPPVLGPSALWTYPGAMQIHSMAITPDGTHAYVSMTVHAVNVWAVMVHRWPEILAVIAILALVIAIRRMAKHDQVAGEPYCRRCNYQLTKIESRRCPECGGKVTGRYRIMGTRRRCLLAVLLAVVIAELVAYIRHADSAQRGSGISDWLCWTSTDLAQKASTPGWGWLQRHGNVYERVAIVDLRDGSLKRVISEAPGHHGYRILVPTPDTKRIIGVRAGDGRIEIIHARSGRRTQTSNDRDAHSIRSIMLDDDGRSLYAVGDRLWRCDVMTGQIEEIPRPPEWPAQARVECASDRGSRLSMRCIGLAANKMDRELRVLEWDMNEGRFVGSKTLPWTWWSAIERDTGRRFIQWSDFDPMRIINVETRLERRLASTAGGFWRHNAVAPNGRIAVAVETQSRRIGVFDLDQAEHIATLQHTALVWRGVVIDDSGQTVWAMLTDAADGLVKIAEFDLTKVVRSEDAFVEGSQP